MLNELDNRVFQHKQFLVQVQGYSEDSLIGVFAFGSMNYNLFESEFSDVDTKVIYLPSYKELVFEKPISELYLYGNEHIEVKDIRLMVEMFKKQNINFVETLFTNFSWINPRYSYLWANTFYAYRHMISSYDINYFVNSVCAQAKGNIRSIQKEYNPKKVVTVLRLYHVLDDFMCLAVPYDVAIYMDNYTRGELLDYNHQNKILTNEQLENYYNWFDDFPTNSNISRTQIIDKAKMNKLFEQWILAFLTERQYSKLIPLDVTKEKLPKV